MRIFDAVVSLVPGLSLVLALASTSFVAAGDFPHEVEREASEVFSSVMSPYCPGKLIANCPSSQAADMREDIRERIAAGASAEDIKEKLFATYGDAVRAAPRTRGFDLIAWMLPPLVVLIGAALTVIWVRRRTASRTMTGERPAEESHDSEVDAQAHARLDEELRRMDTG